MTEEVQTEETQQTEVQQEPAQEPAAADLNISDLLSLKSIVDVASQRGAFKAAELEAVGKTYNKLNAFLESVTKKES